MTVPQPVTWLIHVRGTPRASRARDAWLLVSWPNVPSSVPAPLPSFLPVPLDLYLQVMVTYANGAGSLTNLEVVEVR